MERNCFQKTWALSALLLCLISNSYADFQFSGTYAQTSDFWDTVDQLQKPNGITELTTLLDSGLESPKEALAGLHFGFLQPATGWIDENIGFSRVKFGASLDTLEGGEIRNRILPEIDGYALYTVSASFGMERRPPTFESGIILDLGTTAGIGEARLVNGLASEFTPKIPLRKAALFYSGLTIGPGYQNRISDSIQTRHEFTWQPTWFHSDYTHSASAFAIEKNHWTHRWKLLNEWSVDFVSDGIEEIRFSLHTTLGQQPIPVALLPRIWDQIHSVEPFPSIASLAGLGSSIRFSSHDQILALQLTGGFYGGYFGAGARADLYRFSLTGGTWGVEQTTGYRISESRFKYLSLEYRHAL